MASARLLVVCALIAPLAGFAQEVGVVPATRRVLPSTPVPATRGITLEAARDEWEAYQVLVRGAAPLHGLDVAVSDLVGPGGAVIPAAAQRLYREWPVTVTTPSTGGVTFHLRVAGRYPDPLVPLRDPYDGSGRPVGAPFDLPADETGIVLVDVHVPAYAAAGRYHGSATVTAAGGFSARLDVTLMVWDFSLARRTVGTSFGFSDKTARFHRARDGGAGLAHIRDRYLDALHEHRVDPTTVYGPVSFTFDGGVLQPVDWTAYDSAVGPFLDGTRFSDGVGVTRFDPGLFRPGFGTGGLSEAEYQQAARAFAAHLEEKGWWDRAYVYARDEPWQVPGADEAYANIARDVRLLLEASPAWRFKTLVTSPYDARLDGLVGIWCPVTTMYDDWWWMTAPKPGWDDYSPRLAQGEELWFYVCNANLPPYATYDIDTTIGYEPRIAKWGAWYERGSGFLYWSVDFWPKDDPWNVLCDADEFPGFECRDGDGFLLYPGDHDGTAGGRGSPPSVSLDGPVVSYRLKQVRDGLEDWELFRLATRLGAEAFARQQVRRAYARFGDFFLEDCRDPKLHCPERQPWTLDEDVLLDARRQVALKVQHLVHPDPEAPAVAAPPPAPDGCHCAASNGAVALAAWLLFRRRTRR
ncbi:MAG: glycoside hydrolase domain-containing protein [Myxococcota bacterium]